jgi:hypothetical protein
MSRLRTNDAVRQLPEPTLSRGTGNFVEVEDFLTAFAQSIGRRPLFEFEVRVVAGPIIETQFQQPA